MRWFLCLFDRLFGLDGKGARAAAINDARLAALQPRMAWVYAMVVSCLIGMMITFKEDRRPPVMVIVLAGVTMWRGIVWLRLRKQRIVGPAAVRRLRAIAAGALLNNVLGAIAIAGFCVVLPPAKQQLMMIMTATCTIAFAAPLTALPGSARLSYLLFSVPAAVLGVIIGPERTVSVACFNLMLCALILACLLKVQDRDFVSQLDLRLASDGERARAEHAERIAIEERTLARAMAETDFLTGLANRRAFLAALQERVGLADVASVMILDLDGFKPVNDTFGHDVGDALLKLVAERLRALGLADATVARLGGDEFALLTPNVGASTAEALGRRIVASLSQPYPIGDALISVSACCGIAMLGDGALDTSKVLREADVALYRAKGRGRAGVELYSEGLDDELKRRSEIETALRAPGVEDEIELLYQPIYDLKTKAIRSFEALARWTHSRLGPIAPSDFIPITEQLQVVEPISQALLRRAARTALDWRHDQRLSFNLSAVQLCSFGSSARILRCLDESGLPPSRLQIEVTETAMMADFATARDNLAALQDRGVKVVLDDFGAGYASISYLREMKFDGLKLDGSLIVASQQPDGARLLRGVIDLARQVGVPCIAEHVETAEQARFLTEIGCGCAQGWWFSRPVDAAKAAELAHGGEYSSPAREVPRRVA